MHNFLRLLKENNFKLKIWNQSTSNQGWGYDEDILVMQDSKELRSLYCKKAAEGDPLKQKEEYTE